jgi:hypothetical protein
MAFKIGPVPKTFITEFARVGESLNTAVVLQVLVVFVLGHNLFSAIGHLARELPSRMKQLHMSSQVTAVREPLFTNITRVVQLRGVDVPVLFQMIVGVERFVTNITRKRPLACVEQGMPLQFDRLVKGLLADSALKGPLVRVHGSNVVG